MIGVFYLSLKLAKDSQRILTPSGRSIYIRVEEVESDDLIEALVHATPRQGEMVMNTHLLGTKNV